MRELKFRKCNSCGALVKEIVPCNCRCKVMCCDEVMEEVPIKMENNEKHTPICSVNDGTIFVSMNHVMESEHYIEWICFVNEEEETYKYFKPGETIEVVFPYESGTIYAYCNIHGLWAKEVK